MVIVCSMYMMVNSLKLSNFVIILLCNYTTGMIIEINYFKKLYRDTSIELQRMSTIMYDLRVSCSFPNNTYNVELQCKIQMLFLLSYSLCTGFFKYSFYHRNCRVEGQREYSAYQSKLI